MQRKSSSIVRHILILISCLALVLAACGGDGDGDASSATTAGEESSASTEAPSGDEGSDGTAASSDYYEGKDIHIIVGSSPGGGTDRAARLLGRFLTENLPGNPTVEVENHETASGLVVMNDWLQRMPDDGTYIMFSSSSFHIPWLLGDPIIEFDLAEMNLLWANPSGRVVMVRTDTGVEAPEDLQDPPSEMFHGGRGPQLADLLTLMGFEALGVEDQMTHIWGYGGGGDAALAFEQGEVNIGSRNPSSVATEDQHLIDSGDAILLYSHGRINPDSDADDELVPEPIFPDLPTVEQLYREWYGEDPSGDEWDAFLLVTSVASEAGHAAWLHPTAPPEAVELLRSTIADFVEDPEYIAQHEADLGTPVSPHVGDGLSSVTDRLASLDQETLDWLRTYLSENHDVDLG